MNTNRNKRRPTARASTYSTIHFDPTAPTCVDLVKRSLYTKAESADSYVLSALLATYYDGASRSGFISPRAKRLMMHLGWEEDRFAKAVAELIISERWSIAFPGSGLNPALKTVDSVAEAILEKGVHSIDSYFCQFIDATKNGKHELKSKHISLNYIKCRLRYSNEANGLGAAIELLAIAKTTPKFNDLGYWWFRKHGFHPVHVVPTSNGPRKFFHSVLFDHPMMEATNPDEWEDLAAVDELTPEMVQKPRRAILAAKDIKDWFNLSDETAHRQIWAAIREIEKSGYYTVRVLDEDVFSDGMVERFIMTPTMKLHELVWSFDRDAVGGDNQTRWEKRNGFLYGATFVEGDNPMYSHPKIGYHWLYLLKRRKTGEYVSVGQTTKTLEYRLNQHRTINRNTGIKQIMREIARDPEDALEIECVGEVHHSFIAEYEMRALDKMKELGHPVTNIIQDVVENIYTCKLDIRLKHLPSNECERFLKEQLDYLGPYTYLNKLPVPLEGS